MVKRPRIILYPYKMGSASVKLLQEELRSRGHKVMRVREDGNYKNRDKDLIVVWGNSRPPSFISSRPWINSQHSVHIAQNKLLTFDWLKEAAVPIPEYTSILSEALNWFELGDIVVARASLTGSKGADIHLYDPKVHADMEGQYPLYTKYIKKKAEYRVHVFNGLAIDVQQKKKKTDWVGERDSRIRNLANGYVFCRDGITIPAGVTVVGIEAVKALGLDFGAADVIWNEKHKKAYVLEVNTAPGLEGKTVELYADNIEKIFKERTGL